MSKTAKGLWKNMTTSENQGVSGGVDGWLRAKSMTAAMRCPSLGVQKDDAKLQDGGWAE